MNYLSGGEVLPRIVYTVTLLTTLSLTGIACLLLIWIIYGFTTSNKREGFLLLKLLVCVLLLLYFRLDFFPDSIRFNLVKKIQSVFNGNSRDYVSVTTRVNSIEYGIELLLQRLFCGIGRGLDMLKTMQGIASYHVRPSFERFNISSYSVTLLLSDCIDFCVV